MLFFSAVMDWESDQDKASHYQSRETLKASMEDLRQRGGTQEERRKSRRLSSAASKRSDDEENQKSRGSSRPPSRVEGDDGGDGDANALLAKAMTRMSEEQAVRVSNVIILLVRARFMHFSIVDRTTSYHLLPFPYSHTSPTRSTS